MKLHLLAAASLVLLGGASGGVAAEEVSLDFVHMITYDIWYVRFTMMYYVLGSTSSIHTFNPSLTIFYLLQYVTNKA